MNAPQSPIAHRKGSLLDTARAVLWAFLGVRRKSDFHQDIAKLQPLQLMAVGLLFTFLFVAALMGIVFWVTA